MDNRHALIAATLSLTAGIIALCFSCGRPPGGRAGAPGIAGASPQANVALEHELQLRREAMDKLNQQLNAQMDQHRQTQSRLDDLQVQIAAAQQSLSAGQAGVKGELEQKSTEYAASDIEAQRRDLERQTVQNQLQDEIRKQKESINQLAGVMAQQQSWGFDTQELRDSTARMAEERDNLANLEQQSMALQQQAGEEAVLRSESKRWQEGSDQERTQAGIAAQTAQLTSQLQNLEGEYNQLQEDEQKQRERIGELEQQFRTARDDYQNMQAAP